MTLNTGGNFPLVAPRSSLPKSTLFLDVLGIPAWAIYSTQKYRQDYTGKCLRVRQGSTETDIDFGSNGYIDESALTTAAGGGDLYVVTIYDQSGNGRNAALTSYSTTYAPKIVSGGTVIKDIFNNVSWQYSAGGTNPGDGPFLTNSKMFPPSNRTIMAMVQPTATVPNGALCGTGFQFSGGSNHQISYSNSFGSYGGVMFWAGGGASCSLVQSYGGQPEFVCATVDHTNNKGTIWQNGQSGRWDEPILTPYTPNQVGFIGRDSDNSQKYSGKMSSLVIFASALTDAQAALAWTTAKSKMNYGSVTYIECDGDSLTQGNGSQGSAQSNWMQRLRGILAFDRIYQFYNDGKGGDGIPQMITQASTARTGIDFIKYNDSNPTIKLVAWGGTGDVVKIPATETVNSVYGYAVTYMTGRHAAKTYSQKVWITTLPRENTTITTNAFLFNDALVAGMGGGGTLAPVCDLLIDVRALTAFDADGDYNNGTNYNADKIHLVIAGYDVLVAYIKTEMGLT